MGSIVWFRTKSWSINLGIFLGFLNRGGRMFQWNIIEFFRAALEHLELSVERRVYYLDVILWLLDRRASKVFEPILRARSELGSWYFLISQNVLLDLLGEFKLAYPEAYLEEDIGRIKFSAFRKTLQRAARTPLDFEYIEQLWRRSRQSRHQIVYDCDGSHAADTTTN